MEIGLEMDLPAPTVQAYGDSFLTCRDRITAGSYIHFQVIQMHPLRPPTPVQLMQACAYHHGPQLIEPWMEYIQQEHKSLDLDSDGGRLMESLDLLLSVHALPDDIATNRSLIKRLPLILTRAGTFPVLPTAEGNYRQDNQCNY